MPQRYRYIGVHRGILLLITLCGVWAALELGLRASDLVPGAGGVKVMSDFFSGALPPALTYEAEFVPDGTRPLLLKVLDAAGTTVLFAAASASLSLVFGLGLGFFASTAWWRIDRVGGANPWVRILRRSVAPAVYAFTRVVILLARSIHELIWAVLFLSAMGLTNLTAVIAITIPFSGTFAKLFSEMIDEAPRDTAVALRSAGASSLQVFVFGLLPRVVPDLSAFAFYRFECALRSSVVLGFFGIPTLGYYLTLSFGNAHYREVWTYLYALFLLVAVTDWWSGAARRRMVK